MTTRVEIITSEMDDAGWVEVDPFGYEYTGPDPEGEIEKYLSAVANGEIDFSWADDDENNTGEYPPKLVLMDIRSVLEGFDEIWFLDFPDGYEPHFYLQ